MPLVGRVSCGLIWCRSPLGHRGLAETPSENRPLGGRDVVMVPFGAGSHDVRVASTSQTTPEGATMPRTRIIIPAVLAAVALVAAAATAIAQSQRFPDVPPDHYAYEAVEWAAEAGVTAGYTDGTFKPEQPLIKRHAGGCSWSATTTKSSKPKSQRTSPAADMMVLLKAINDGSLRADAGRRRQR